MSWTMLLSVSLLLGLLWYPTFGEASRHSHLLVKTTTGRVKGRTTEAATGKLVNVWSGIPYAQPPVGSLRFRHPQPIDPWDDVIDVTDAPKSCWQMIDESGFAGNTVWNPVEERSEDCLYLTIVSPYPRPKNADVMVWIHGGAFLSGATTLEQYDPKILVSEENVVFASLQYRLASLGFLYLDSADVPGNMGMFDQVMGLQWIKNNIGAFGGDPNKITLFGESAGAASVSMHLLSPLSRNLFNRAIMQSASATAPWATVDREELLIRSLKLAKAVGCPHDPQNTKAAIDCLRQAEPSALISAEEFPSGIVQFPFVPIIDGAFLDEPPQQSLNTGNFKKTSILMGSTKEEGTMFILGYLNDTFSVEDTVHVNRQDFVSSVSKLYPSANRFGHQAIIHEYTDWLNPEDSSKNQDAIDKMVGDYQFTCKVNEFAEHYAEAGNDVFMYHYTHRSSVHLWPKWAGVVHADEINFVFGEPLNPTKGYLPEEMELSKNMMHYWANFARTGNPSRSPDDASVESNWPLYSRSSPEYLILSTNGLSIGNGLRVRQCAFWSQLYPILQSAAHCTCTAPVSSSSNSSCAKDDAEENTNFTELEESELHLL